MLAQRPHVDGDDPGLGGIAAVVVGGAKDSHG
jgi:hypothetical protein